MFEKNLKFAYLVDIYGELIDENTSSVMKAYYDDDLSLSEIAEGVGISRQGVWQIIQKGKKELSFFEEKLSLLSREERRNEAIELISGTLERDNLPDDTMNDLKAALSLLKAE